MTAQSPKKRYPAEPIVQKGELPNLFTWPDSDSIITREEWPECSKAWRDLILEMEYGGLPPQPKEIDIESLCHSNVRHWPDTPNLWSYRVHCHGGKHLFPFCVKVLFPNRSGPFPTIINGDGCWWHILDSVVQRILDSGCALVMFDRTEMAEDLGYPDVRDKTERSGGLYDVYPEHKFGALSAWAWGYHRCVDLLYKLPFIDTERIVVTGHSRGGKTALVAGATDKRITLINDNASGAGGGAPFRFVGDGGETLNIIKVFPSWFGEDLDSFLGREEDMPFDQHCLLAAIAPRPLLLTYALDDRWSNPEGMVQCTWAAGEVYRFLEVPHNLAFHLREGTHSHAPEDWDVLLDFIAWKWLGKEPMIAYNFHPYGHLKPVFSWKAPHS